MCKLRVLCILSSLIGAIAAGEDLRPRGVGPEFAKYYKSSNTFACISSPSVVLSASQVNDDYCDCPDGSDEPGTSACSFISDLSPSSPSAIDHPNTSLALPGYYCKNKGHRPSYVAFIDVNDGVCNYELCCDGSDEWAQVGDVTCENRCKEVAKEWKKLDDQRQKSLSSAGKKKKELLAVAARLRKEVEGRIETLQTEIEGFAIKAKDLESALADVEKRERGKVVHSPGKGGKISVLAGLAKTRIEELRAALINTREQRDMGSSRIAELEEILTTFKEEYNPNFNDEGVKRAVRSWEEYAARDKPSISDDAHDRDLDEMTKPDDESGAIQWSEWEESGESDIDVLYKFEEYLPAPVRDWLDRKLRDLRVLLVDNGILAPTPSSGMESKPVTDARAALKAAQDSLDNSRTQLHSHEGDLQQDYGAHDIFRALKGHCISVDSGDYKYELCWLGQAKQKAKKGGAETGMGSFVRIDSVSVDEDLPPDGRGLGSGVRVALRYENGQHCWNGPNRSTLVVLACADRDEVWRVAEEEKCVYRMEVGTPAVCELEGEGGSEAGKDEL